MTTDHRGGDHVQIQSRFAYRCPPYAQSFHSPVQPTRARMELNNGH